MYSRHFMTHTYALTPWIIVNDNYLSILIIHIHSTSISGNRLLFFGTYTWANTDVHKCAFRCCWCCHFCCFVFVCSITVSQSAFLFSLNTFLVGNWNYISRIIGLSCAKKIENKWKIHWYFGVLFAYANAENIYWCHLCHRRDSSSVKWADTHIIWSHGITDNRIKH